MATAVPVIRSASLHGYVELARSLGLQPEILMRQTGLSARCLDDPEMPISVAAVRELLETSARLTGIEDFGLQMARGRRLANLGPISIVLREASTARQALDTLVRYLRLLNSSLLTQIEEHGDLVVIREDVLVDGTGGIRQSIELAVGVMHRILVELLGAQWRARQVCFAHRAPADLTSHRAMFGQDPEFNAGFSGIVCAAQDLTARLPTLDSGMAVFARRFLDQAMTVSRGSTSDSVRKLIAALLPGGRCTAEQVAHHLRIDRRTLHRHLAGEGETFSSLMVNVRRDFATRLIRDGDHPLAELAELLGFSAASVFAFWFRRQFGCTVSQWRGR